MTAVYSFKNTINNNSYILMSAYRYRLYAMVTIVSKYIFSSNFILLSH